MDKIPPELVYVVCSLLSIDDVLNFRLVNKLFADVGAAYMLPEVTFFMHREELDRLEAISLHPIFSKHVCSLVYFAETLGSPKVTWPEFVRQYKRQMRLNHSLMMKKRELAAHQLNPAYKEYCDAVDEQDRYIAEERDLNLLKQVLPRFPRLEGLTMSAGNFYSLGRCLSPRKKPYADFLRDDIHVSGLHPEGKRPLDALLLANAHSPCALRTLRAGSLHWRFFKRPERDLRPLFSPLANLTAIDLCVSVDPADERIYEGNSLRKCQRVLAKGSIRKILRSMPHLQTLAIEILNLKSEEQEKGAWLGDIIEPGFRWPNLKDLTLGGIVCNRMQLTSVLTLHKDTLKFLCLRDVALASTSWRKLLPDIRKTLDLEDACICGDIYGECEDEADILESWNHPMDPPGFECWDLSVPEVGAHDMRQSINMYCRHGGKAYPEELPLSDYVVDKYYDEYVGPSFEDEEDEEDEDDGYEWQYAPDDEFFLNPLREEDDEDDEVWEDVSDEEVDHALGDESTDAGGNVPAFFDAAMAAANVGPPTFTPHYNDHDHLVEDQVGDEMLADILDAGSDGMDDYDDIDMDMEPFSSIMALSLLSAFAPHPDTSSDDMAELSD
ncbi:hypothetical protein F4777DRAFT_12509 [Nemania sp. FL0916]|nr:hypothetical protein F4777DRAFT_12509 [Nemania sp. FL0916]